MRKLEFIAKKKYDVVIIDDTASQWLDHCIPNKCTSFAIKTDNTVPFVKSLSFLYNLFISLVKNGLTSTSLLSAIILELKPKVIITFIDNNRFMGPLQTIFPDILVISVQNGTRLNDPSFKSLEKYLTFPHYFGFGNHEYNMMKEKNANVKEYYSKGSLRMGIFLSNLYVPTIKSNDIKNICFISPYSSDLADSTDLSCTEFISLNQEFCRNLFKFSQENNIGVTVAMRSELTSEEYQNELNFFENIFGRDGATYCANDRINMSSYQIGMDSSLIVCVMSTLLYELFGAGKKILCISGTTDGVLNDERQYDALPNEVLLDSLNYDEFKGKVNTLLKMDSDDFLRKTKNARKYYMNFGNKYPHQIIYNAIQQRCR